MKSYVSFTDEDEFSGLTLPEKSPMTQTKEVTPEGAQPTQAKLPCQGGHHRGNQGTN